MSEQTLAITDNCIGKNPEQKIARPRQIFVGQPRRELSDAKGLAARAKSKK